MLIEKENQNKHVNCLENTSEIDGLDQMLYRMLGFQRTSSAVYYKDFMKMGEAIPLQLSPDLATEGDIRREIWERL